MVTKIHDFAGCATQDGLTGVHLARFGGKGAAVQKWLEDKDAVKAFVEGEHACAPTWHISTGRRHSL